MPIADRPIRAARRSRRNGRSFEQAGLGAAGLTLKLTACGPSTRMLHVALELLMTLARHPLRRHQRHRRVPCLRLWTP